MQDEPDFNHKGCAPSLSDFWFSSNFQQAEAFEGVLGRKPFIFLVPKSRPVGGGQALWGSGASRSGQRRLRGRRGRSPTGGGRARSDSSATPASRASTGGRRPAHHTTLLRSVGSKQPPALLCSSRRARKEGNRRLATGKHNLSLFSHHGRCDSLPRPQTDFLESTELSLPDRRPLELSTSFTDPRELPPHAPAGFLAAASRPAFNSQGVAGPTRPRLPELDRAVGAAGSPPPATRVRTPGS